MIEGREYKFRIYDKKNDVFTYGSFGGNTGQPRFDIANELHNDDESDYGVWQQSTSLKDKNGVEVYEGDVLAYKRDVGVVTYEGTEFVAISKMDLDWCNLLMPEAEVIGNVYQTPDLLPA